MKAYMNMAEALPYKPWMFVLLIDSNDNLFCGNYSVHKNTIITDNVKNNKHHYIVYHRRRKVVAAKTIRVAKQVIENNLADMFRKIMKEEGIRF